MEKIFTNNTLHVVVEKSEIPWLKIFTNEKIKELSQCDKSTKEELFEMMEICEKTMIEYYNPTKINIAMFGNYLPHLHIHVMARFQEDSYFPESMWGVKQREAKLNLPPFDDFVTLLLKRVRELHSTPHNRP